jgi:hypothetical protein
MCIDRWCVWGPLSCDVCVTSSACCPLPAGRLRSSPARHTAGCPPSATSLWRARSTLARLSPRPLQPAYLGSRRCCLRAATLGRCGQRAATHTPTSCRSASPRCARLPLTVGCYGSAFRASTSGRFPWASLQASVPAFPGLTELRVGRISDDRDGISTAAQLQRFPQLRSLELGSWSSEGGFLPALTALTHLSLGDGADALCLKCLAPELCSLKLIGGKLDVASLAQLPALQSLEVQTLTDYRLLGASEGGWRMPLQLAELRVGPGYYGEEPYMPAELLAHLHAPPGMVEKVSLQGPPSQGPPSLEVRLCSHAFMAEKSSLMVDKSSPSAEGEALLRRALRFLGQHLQPGTTLRVASILTGYGLPVGGLDGVGPKCRNHAWLAELGALQGPLCLWMGGWRFSAQDVEALSRLPGIDELQLLEREPMYRGSRVQLPELRLLARSPSLRRMIIGVETALGIECG